MAMAMEGEREAAARGKEGEMEGSDSLDASSLTSEASLMEYGRQVFHLCDSESHGFITREDVAQFCDRRNSTLDSVMAMLDTDNDGKISFDDFIAGFKMFSGSIALREAFSPALSSPPASLSSSPSTSTPHHPPPRICLPEETLFESEGTKEEGEGEGEGEGWGRVAGRVDPSGLLKGTSVEKVWSKLPQTEPVLAERFEGFLSDVVEELQRQHSERDSLEDHVKRVRSRHSREVSEMEELLEQELDQVKRGESMKKASQAKLLSSQFEGLLAAREVIIEELSEKESVLRQQLANHTSSERALKEERASLINVNTTLQLRLDSSMQRLSSSQRALARLARLEAGGGADRQASSSPDPRDDLILSHSAPVGGFTAPLSCGGGGACVQGRHPVSGGVFYSETRLSGGWQLSETRLSGGGRELKWGEGEEEEEEWEELRWEEEEEEEDGEEISRTAPVEASGSDDTSSHDNKPTSGVSRYHGNSPVLDLASCSHELGSRRLPVGGAEGRATDSLTMSSWLPRREDLPRPSSPHDVSRVFKVVFLGNSGVGKSSLIARLCEGGFRAVLPTVGLDFSTKTLRLSRERVVFQLWDTAGQERFLNALTPVYYRRADAFVITYDVTDKKSFKDVHSWLSIVTAALRERPPVVMVVGNKSDVSVERAVSLEEGRRLALELQALFSETSALSGDNVLQAHTTLARLLLAREDDEIERARTRAIELTDSATPISKRKCAC